MEDNRLDLLLKGELVLPKKIARNSAVGLKDEKIVGIYHKDNCPPAIKTIDASGKLVFPGLVDPHVHCYSNPQEGYEKATAAAAAGGVTTILDMPYDAGDPVNTTQVFEKKLAWLKEKEVKVDVALFATLNKNGDQEAVLPVIDMGACGFKLSVFETDPHRFPRIEDDVLWHFLPAMAERGVPVSFHAENDIIINSLIFQYKTQGKNYPLAHCQTRPPITETIAVAKLLEFAYWTKVPMHFCHISHPHSLDLIGWYRKQGVDLSVETCPHYLLISQENMDHLKAKAKFNPCAREKEDTEALWKALLRGEIDFLGTDHVAWLQEEKEKEDIFANASGHGGLEVFFSLIYTHGVIERNLTPCELAWLMAKSPAERFGLAPRKGAIDIGADADLIVVDPEEKWTYDASKNFSISKWSPYDGMKLTGRVKKTILRGELVYDGNQVLQDSHQGRFVPAVF